MQNWTKNYDATLLFELNEWVTSDKITNNYTLHFSIIKKILIEIYFFSNFTQL